MSPEYAAEPGSLLRRVPGPVRPRAEVEADFRAHRPRYLDPTLDRIFGPKIEDQYRWKVQLECGCVFEAVTHGKDDFPDRGTWSDTAYGTGAMPRGEMLCHNLAEHRRERPYREIEEWLWCDMQERPADPDTDEDPSGALSPDVWRKLRHAEPHSFAWWVVRLSCGHRARVVTDTDWRPEDGPTLVTEERAREMRAQVERLRESDPDAAEGPWWEHQLRMIDRRSPRPSPERECFLCMAARRITGYQRIGWLVPRPKPPKPPKSERQVAEEQLKRAEAEVRRLQGRLKNL